MTRSRIRGGFAGLTAALVFGLTILVLEPSPQRESTQAADPPKKPRPASKPIPIPANLAGLETVLGLKDTKPTKWDGTIEVSEGRVLEIECLAVPGGPAPQVTQPRRAIHIAMLGRSPLAAKCGSHGCGGTLPSR